VFFLCSGFFKFEKWNETYVFGGLYLLYLDFLSTNLFVFFALFSLSFCCLHYIRYLLICQYVFRKNIFYFIVISLLFYCI